jgi:hypothetical protein
MPQDKAEFSLYPLLYPKAKQNIKLYPVAAISQQILIIPVLCLQGRADMP